MYRILHSADSVVVCRLLVEFRVWLDGARMAFLLVAHFGMSIDMHAVL